MELQKCPNCGKYMISSIIPSYGLTWTIQYSYNCGYSKPQLQFNYTTNTNTIGEQNGLYGK